MAPLKKWPKGGTTPEIWRRPLERIASWVPVDLLLAWIDTESGGIPTIISNIGERGLFQVHPSEQEFFKISTTDFENLTKDSTLALRIGVNIVKAYATFAKKELAAVNTEWHGRDFWKLVKLYHGAFAMPKFSLQAFQRVNGRAPSDWSELIAFAKGEAAAGRQLIDGAGGATLKALTNKVFDNAEKTGEASELPIINRDKIAQVAPLLRSFGLLL